MSADAPSRTFTVVRSPVSCSKSACRSTPREVFGTARAPVHVAIGDYRYCSTVCTMRGEVFVPLARVHRDAAGVIEGKPLTVTLTLDRDERRVDSPADLRAALKVAGVWDGWQRLSFTTQLEHAEAVEQAMKPETRARRIERCIAALTDYRVGTGSGPE